MCENKEGRAHDDLWCIAVIILWVAVGFVIGMVIGAVCIALPVLVMIFLHDQPIVYAWVLLFIGMAASIITLLVIKKWLACPEGTK